MPEGQIVTDEEQAKQASVDSWPGAPADLWALVRSIKRAVSIMSGRPAISLTASHTKLIEKSLTNEGLRKFVSSLSKKDEDTYKKLASTLVDTSDMLNQSLENTVRDFEKHWEKSFKGLKDKSLDTQTISKMAEEYRIKGVGKVLASEATRESAGSADAAAVAATKVPGLASLLGGGAVSLGPLYSAIDLYSDMIDTLPNVTVNMSDLAHSVNDVQQSTKASQSSIESFISAMGKQQALVGLTRREIVEYTNAGIEASRVLRIDAGEIGDLIAQYKNHGYTLEQTQSIFTTAWEEGQRFGASLDEIQTAVRDSTDAFKQFGYVAPKVMESMVRNSVKLQALFSNFGVNVQENLSAIKELASGSPESLSNVAAIASITNRTIAQVQKEFNANPAEFLKNSVMPGIRQQYASSELEAMQVIEKLQREGKSTPALDEKAVDARRAFAIRKKQISEQAGVPDELAARAMTSRVDLLFSAVNRGSKEAMGVANQYEKAVKDGNFELADQILSSKKAQKVLGEEEAMMGRLSEKRKKEDEAWNKALSDVTSQLGEVLKQFRDWGQAFLVTVGIPAVKILSTIMKPITGLSNAVTYLMTDVPILSKSLRALAAVIGTFLAAAFSFNIARSAFRTIGSIKLLTSSFSDFVRILTTASRLTGFDKLIRLLKIDKLASAIGDTFSNLATSLKTKIMKALSGTWLEEAIQASFGRGAAPAYSLGQLVTKRGMARASRNVRLGKENVEALQQKIRETGSIKEAVNAYRGRVSAERKFKPKPSKIAENAGELLSEAVKPKSLRNRRLEFVDKVRNKRLGSDENVLALYQDIQGKSIRDAIKTYKKAVPEGNRLKITPSHRSSKMPIGINPGTTSELTSDILQAGLMDTISSSFGKMLEKAGKTKIATKIGGSTLFRGAGGVATKVGGGALLRGVGGVARFGLSLFGGPVGLAVVVASMVLPIILPYLWKATKWLGSAIWSVAKGIGKILFGIPKFFLMLPFKLLGWVWKGLTGIAKFELSLAKFWINAFRTIGGFILKLPVNIIRTLIKIPTKIFSWLWDTIANISAFGLDLSTNWVTAFGAIGSFILKLPFYIARELLKLPGMILKWMWDRVTGGVKSAWNGFKSVFGLGGNEDTSGKVSKATKNQPIQSEPIKEAAKISYEYMPVSQNIPKVSQSQPYAEKFMANGPLSFEQFSQLGSGLNLESSTALGKKTPLDYLRSIDYNLKVLVDQSAPYFEMYTNNLKNRQLPLGESGGFFNKVKSFFGFGSTPTMGGYSGTIRTQPTVNEARALENIKANIGPNSVGIISALKESKGDFGISAPDVGSTRSYGAWQINTKGGAGSTMGKFLPYLQQTNPQIYQALAPAASQGFESQALSQTWAQVAQGPMAKQFAQAQYDFIKQTHFDPAMQRAMAVAQQLGPAAVQALNDRRVQELVFSTAVQFGPANDIIAQALQSLGPNVSAENLISAITQIKAGRRPQEAHRYMSEQGLVMGMPSSGPSPIMTASETLKSYGSEQSQTAGMTTAASVMPAVATMPTPQQSLDSNGDAVSLLKAIYEVLSGDSASRAQALQMLQLLSVSSNRENLDMTSLMTNAVV